MGSPVRIQDGFDLFSDPDGRWFYSTPDLTFHRIRGPQDVIADVATLLERGPIEPRSVTSTEQSLLHGLRERGVVVTGASPESRRTVLCDIGSGTCGDVVRLLGDAGMSVCVGDASVHDLSTVDVVVATSAAPCDDAWSTLDRRCAEAGVAWHRACVEGGGLVVGPLTVPGRTAGHVDCRGRRVAASRTPDELTSYWRHHDNRRARGAVRRRPLGAVDAVGAGFLSADVVSWARGDHDEPGVQRVVDVRSAAVTVHPVLPLPVTAARR